MKKGKVCFVVSFFPSLHLSGVVKKSVFFYFTFKYKGKLLLMRLYIITLTADKLIDD